MGACGCGDNSPGEVYKVGRDKYLGVAPYLGCDYCGTGIGYDITFMDRDGRRVWAYGIPVEPLEFNQDCGTNNGMMLGCVGLEELLRAVDKLQQEQRVPVKFKGYRTVQEWLHDYGLVVLQEAFRIHLAEVRKSREDARARSTAQEGSAQQGEG